MKNYLCLGIFFLLGKIAVFSQPLAIFNDSYWHDGNAEFCIYQAQFARYGQLRDCEFTQIWVKEAFDPKQLVKADDWQAAGNIEVLKINQIYHIPTGIYFYQQMLSHFYALQSGDLLKFSLSSNDACGNSFKIAERQNRNNIEVSSQTYWQGMTNIRQKIKHSRAQKIFFLDELLLRARELVWGKVFENQQISVILPSVVSSKADNYASYNAELVAVKKGENIAVELRFDDSQIAARHNAVYVFGQNHPYLLLAYSNQSGENYRLKTANKIPYWQLNQIGDRQKALQRGKLYPRD